jgi:hypothetical protein
VVRVRDSPDRLVVGDATRDTPHLGFHGVVGPYM